MNYPLITEYIDSIRSAEDSFDKLTNLINLQWIIMPDLQVFTLNLEQ